MKYYILQQNETGNLFLLEAEGINLEEEKEEGNIFLGEFEFSGTALRAERMIERLETGGFDSDIFSAYKDQIATAVYKAVIKILQKELNLKGKL